MASWKGTRLLGSTLLLVLGSVGRAGAAEGSPNQGMTLLAAIGDAKSVGQSPFIGEATETVALELPPGRLGVIPSLGLLYSSYTQSTSTGLGWDLPVGSIERSTKQGVPAISNTDEFTYSLGSSGGGLLVPVATGQYRAEIEPEFRTFSFDGTTWTMRDAQGKLFRYGSSPDNRIDGIRWMLDSVEDTRGNTIAVTYMSDGGTLYPTELRYTGHAPTGDPGASVITLEYEPRPDVRTSFIHAVRQTRAERLRRISMFVESDLVRRYDIGYTTSQATGRSLLSGLGVVGRDDASTIPFRDFEYHTQVAGWVGGATGVFPVAFQGDDGKDLGVRAVDVNADGFVDLVQNGTNVWLSTRSGGFALSTSWSASLQASGVTFVNGDGIGTGGQILDVNGDARADLILATSSTHRVLLNDGTGWVNDSAYTTSLAAIREFQSVSLRFLRPDLCPIADAGAPGVDCDQQVGVEKPFTLNGPEGISPGTQLGDVNGDGLTDLVWSFDSSPSLFEIPVGDAGAVTGIVPARTRAVYLNTGSGWARNDTLSDALDSLLQGDPDNQVGAFVVDSHLQGYDLIDVNGDGLADIVRTSSEFLRDVFLNTGLGWRRDADYTNSLRATEIVTINAEAKNQGTLALDINGDGLVDYIRADDEIARAWRNTGTGWVQDTTASADLASLSIVTANADGQPQGVVTGDFDGNGLADLLRSKSGSSNLVYPARGPIAGDRLAVARSALGETTSLEYAVSTSYDNTGGDGVFDLPLTLTVLSRLTRSDGRGGTHAYDYSYEGGLFTERELRGFRTTTGRTPRNVTTRIRFNQSKELVGQPETIETLDASLVVRKRTTLGYNLVSAAPRVTQVQQAVSDEEIFDDGGTTHTRMRRSYDQFLNVVELAKEGEVTLAGDEGRTVYQYATNESAGIFALPSRIQSFDAAGTQLSESKLFYDDRPFGQATRGDLTRVVDTLRPGVTVSRFTKYDRYGNPTHVSDRLGNVAKFTYDDVHHAFRVKAEDPLGRTARTAYDPGIGRIVREVDINGNRTLFEYDTFGRPTVERRPGDECSLQGSRQFTYSALGDPTAQFVQLSYTETPGMPAVITTRSFFDAYGQIHRVETEGANARTSVVTRDHDDAGQETRISLPYYSTETPQYTLYTRDALARLVTITHPDGQSETSTFAGSLQVDIDRGGGRSEMIRNAFGRITEYREFVGTDVQTTRYEYDASGQHTKTIDALGQVTSLEYDALGRRTRLSDPTVGTYHYGYDDNGNLTKETDPKGRVTKFEYNKNSELVRKRFPDGTEHRFVFGDDKRHNTIGRVAKVIDSAGTLELKYDPQGQVVERRRTLASGLRSGNRRTFVTGYGYDSLGRLKRLVYPDGLEAKYHYNSGGFVERVTDEHGETLVEARDYSATGQVLDMRFGNGVESKFQYSPDGFLTSLRTVRPGGAPLQSLAYAYDSNKNVSSITDAAFGRNQSFEYDSLNRLTKAVGPYGNQVYRYDALGSLVRKSNLVFLRDEHRRQQVTCAIDLSLAAKHQNGIVAHSPLQHCARELLDPASGLTDEERETLRQILAKGRRGGDVGESLEIRYDELGNMVSRTGDRDETKHYGYDAENHLLKVSAAHSPPHSTPRPGHHDPGPRDHAANARTLVENVYDASGQRVVERPAGGRQNIFIDGIYEELGSGEALHHVRVGSMLVASMKFKRPQRLMSSAPVDPLSRCQEVAHTLPAFSEWYSENRPPVPTLVPMLVRNPLLAAKLGGVFAVFAAMVAALIVLVRRRGLHLARAAAASFGGWCRGWLGHPLRRGLALTTVAVYLLNMGCSPAEPGGAAIAQNVRNHEKPSVLYMHLDHVGNVNVVTGDHGRQEARHEYKPFGEQHLNQSSPEASGLQLSLNGHRNDEASGLYYFRARHYDAQLGRFITADVKSVDSNTPQAAHRYAFNLNNPIRYSDPTGQDVFDFLLGLAVAIVVVIVVVATGGAALPLIILLGAIVLGAAVGAVLAATGVIDVPIGRAILLGAFAGALLAGGAIGVVALAAGGTTLAAFVASTTLIGAALGGAGGLTAIAVTGGGTLDDYIQAMLVGALIGAIIGAAIGLGVGLGLEVGVSPALDGGTINFGVGVEGLTAEAVASNAAKIGISLGAGIATGVVTAVGAFLGGAWGAAYVANRDDQLKNKIDDIKKSASPLSQREDTAAQNVRMQRIAPGRGLEPWRHSTAFRGGVVRRTSPPVPDAFPAVPILTP